MNNQRFTTAKATVAMLAEAYRRPLKLGIHRDIIAALNGSVAPRTVSDALRLYVGNPRYLKSCVAGADRIGLDGNPAGQVSDKDADSAKIRRKAKDAKWRRELWRGKQATSHVVEPIKPAPRRISLADLRAASQARRAKAVA
jgi:sRNA-binding protein